MKARLVVALAVAVLAAGCARTESADVGETPAAAPAADRQAVAGDDVTVALALLDRGEVPAAIEPLERALASGRTPPDMSRADLELLLGQARAATSETFAEEQIARLRNEQFEEYMASGRLPSVPYFDDERIDAYFRKVLVSKRPEAREIRERRRG